MRNIVGEKVKPKKNDLELESTNEKVHISSFTISLLPRITFRIV